MIQQFWAETADPTGASGCGVSDHPFNGAKRVVVTMEMGFGGEPGGGKSQLAAQPHNS